mgnify:CR=1 FL=1
MKPKGQKSLTDEQKRELLSYHNKGLSYVEVASLMRVKPGVIKNKAFNMGVSLNGVSNG